MEGTYELVNGLAATDESSEWDVEPSGERIGQEESGARSRARPSRPEGLKVWINEAGQEVSKERN